VTRKLPRKVIISLTLAASLFTDPSIAPKYLGLPPSGYIAAVMMLVFYQIVFLLSRRRFHLRPEVLSLAAGFLLYAFISLFYRYVAEQAIGDFSLHIMMIANFFFMLLLLTDKDFQDTLMPAIFIAGILHFVTLFPDPLGWRANLIAATAYDFGTGGLSELSRRETGLFPAPAMLVAFSLALFVVAFFNFSSGERKIRSFAFMTIAVALGLATFNRSFPIGFVLTFLVLSWCTGARTRLLALYAIGATALFLLPLGEYAEFVGNRMAVVLEGGLSDSPRWTGNTGIVAGFEIFRAHPIFGNPVAPDGGMLQALGDYGQIVNPHNGFVLILAVYGLFGGAPILAFYGLSITKAFRVLANRQRLVWSLRQGPSRARTQTVFTVISASLLIILMIEPLSEYGFMFLLSISPLITSLPSFPPKRKIKNSDLVLRAT